MDGADESHDIVETLSGRLECRVLAPDTAAYDQRRQVWNARIDRYPAAIVLAEDVADVSAAIEMATELDQPVSAKGGGHHVGGSAVVEGGIMIDLSAMNQISVDSDARTVTAGGGATWGEVDAATQPFGLAAVGGQDPNIGIAGLTLGGGVGWLSRAYGLAADNLLEAEVVTASGEVVTASEDENADLFWGLRGAGGALGIVTSFTFELHPVETVFAGSLVYPLEDAEAVLRGYRDLSERAPDTLRPLFGLFDLPPTSPLADNVGTSRVAIIIVCCIEPFDAAEAALVPLRERTEPLVDSIKERLYQTFQGAGESEPHARTSLRSQYVETLTDEAIERIVEAGRSGPSAGATVFVSPRGGAEVEPSTKDSAYPHRTACHHVLIEARWDDPADDERHVQWVTDGARSLESVRLATGSINFIDADEPDERARAAFGPNYKRVAALKRRWDPDYRLGGHGRSSWVG